MIEPIRQPGPLSEAPPAGFVLDVVPRKMPIHYVSAGELDDVANLGVIAAVYLAFFSLLVGAALSFGVVLVTTTGLGDRAYAVFVALTAVSTVGAILCGAVFWVSLRRGRNRLNEIKRDPRGAAE